MKKLAKALALLLAAVMLLSLCACGGKTASASTASDKTDSSAPAKTDAPKADAATTAPGKTETGTSVPADPDAVKRGGILKLAILVTPNQSGFPISTGTDQNVLATTAIESLGRYDENGQIYGFLAKEIITKPEVPAIILELQEGVKYHDGYDFNAKSVCETYDILLENGREANFANVEKYEATGEYEVTITLKQWRTDAVETLCITCGKMFSPKAYRDHDLEWMYTNIVGTGPFVQTEFTIGEKVTFKRNDNYWIEGQPYLDGVEWIVCADQTAAVNMLKTGDVNLIVYPSMQNYKTLLDAGFTRYGVDSCANIAGDLGMFFASGKEGQAVSDLKVRQAICHAIDHEALCNAFTEGLGVVTNQLGVPGTKENNPDVKGYPFDKEKAKALLKEAGYGEGECEVTLTFTPAFENVFVAVQNMLEEVGIKVIIDETDSIGDKLVVGGKDPYVSICWWSAPTSVSAWFRYFSEHPTTMVGDALDLKAAGIIDCYDKCMTAPTEADQKAAMMELARLCVDEYCLYCPFYATLSYYIGDDTIHDSDFGMRGNTQWTPETTWLG